MMFRYAGYEPETRERIKISRPSNALNDPRAVEKLKQLWVSSLTKKQIAAQMCVTYDMLEYFVSNHRDMFPVRNGTHFWSGPGTEEELRDLVARHYSATKIALLMGMKSRFVVIGKCQRLGLKLTGRRSNKSTCTKDGDVPKRMLKGATGLTQLKFSHKPKHQTAVSTPEPKEKLLPLGISLFELKDGQCHKLTGEAMYCGLPTSGRRAAYCEQCRETMYQPVRPKSPQRTQIKMLKAY